MGICQNKEDVSEVTKNKKTEANSTNKGPKTGTGKEHVEDKKQAHKEIEPIRQPKFTAS